ncbi:MAG TPA: zinc-binding alcohol dehydrogenase [Chthonomonadaceae bacterium]|nr:zinc-binding alcohol dehydrogenase [Chthonomonadaceae bacterium]
MAVNNVEITALQAGEHQEEGRAEAVVAAAEPVGQPWRVYHIGFRAPGQTEIFHYDEGPLPEGCVRVRTLYCGISTGTELTHFQGTNPYLSARWDDELKLFADDGCTEYPLPFSGYMQVGRVVESRSPAFPTGEVVAMTYGHKTGHTADPKNELLFPLPADMDPILGIYVAQMGPICANGVLHADEEAYGQSAQAFGVGVRGRNVLVCGTGVIGLMTALMCQWAGASEVAVAGRNDWKLSVAESLGLIPINTQKTDVGRWAKLRWHDGAGNRGAHVAFQCSGSDELLHLALRSLQPQAAVIDLGFYQDGAEQVKLGQEFHHNGLKHICAQIYRVPRKLCAQWDRRRLGAVTLDFLRDKGNQVKERLITHTLPFESAQQAFDLLANDGKKALQVVLRCE